MKEEVIRCMILNNFLGGLWALQMIKDINRTDIYNYDLAKARIEMYKLVKAKFWN